MKLERSLNIFYVVDKNFIPHFTVSLTSLLENNKDLHISVYVIHDLQDASVLQPIIDFFSNKYSVRLNLKELDNQVFDNIPTNFAISTYISKAAYFRLLLTDIIPGTVRSGLYIDCDTIVTGSLKDLIDISFKTGNGMEEYSLMAVSDDNEVNDIERLKVLGIDTRFYFNSGVMLVNLEKWRAEDASAKLLQVTEEYRDHLKWLDQDVLNIYFINKTGRLKPIYNTIASVKSAAEPIILHFSGSSKPWHYMNRGPYKHIYWKYLRMTPFKNVQFEKVTLKKILKKYVSVIKSLPGAAG